MLYKVEALEENLWAINEINKTIMYFICGEEAVLLIDTGLGLTPLKEVIKEYCGNKKIIVVNTHSHLDHNSGNNQFDKVYVGRFDEPYAHEIMGSQMKEMGKRMFFENNVAASQINLDTWKPGPAKQIKTLKTGDIFSIGGYDLEVLEVPSHTLGSIVLIEKKMGWMFSGDIFLTWGVWGHLSDYKSAMSVSLKVYGESVHNLLKYIPYLKTIFPAHGMAQGNPEGCSEYRITPQVIDIYDKGIAEILSGVRSGKDYTAEFAQGKMETFSIGGILYNKERMD